MTRYKRRKIAAAVKCMLLLLAPFAAAEAVKGVELLKSAAEKMNGISAVGSVEKNGTSTEYTLSRGNSTKDLLNGGMILSEGYGDRKSVV